MRFLFHYLRQHWLSLSIIIILLFALAQCDLALPSYMGRIVDVGIVGQGISEKVATVYNEQNLDYFVKFLEEETAHNIDNIYQPMEKTSSNLKKYPLLASENLFILDQKQYHLYQADLEASTRQVALFIFHPDLDSSDKWTLQEDKTEVKQSRVEYLRALYLEIGIDLTHKQINYILHTSLIMILIALATIIITTTSGFFTARLAGKLGYQMRRDVYHHVTDFSGAEIDHFTTSSLITRTTVDISQVQGVLSFSSRIVIYAPILAIGGIVRIWQQALNLTWIIGLATGLILGMVILLIVLVKPKFTLLQKLTDQLNMLMRQTLTGQLVIRAFNTEQVEADKFDQKSQEFAQTTLHVNNRLNLINPLLVIILNGAIMAVIWFAARVIAVDGTLEVGQISAIAQYALMILNAFVMMTMLVMMIPRVAVSLERINEVLQTEPIIKEPTSPQRVQSTRIVFESVSFGYPLAEKEVIADVDLVIEEGQVIGIIGSTGCGKSTLLRLLLRFYDPTRGRITLGGVDLKEIASETLHQHLCFIEQKPVLFSGTIRSNLLMSGQQLNDEELFNYLDLAQIGDFVRQLDLGLDSPVAQGGANFSGGQKQRLAIARALIHQGVLIFDDAMSALDANTDACLRKALAPLLKMRNTGAIIVSQRISSILHADLILVMESGRIVARGSHQQLLQDCPIYQQIYRTQFQGEAS